MWWETSTFTTTRLTNSLDDVVHIVQNKAIGQRDLRNGYIVQTESSVARCAMEMDVLIVERMMMFAVTEFVLNAAAAILDSMNQIVCKEKTERAEDGRFVECEECILKIGHAQRMAGTSQSPTNQNAICGWFDATLLESFNNYVRFHLALL